MAAAGKTSNPEIYNPETHGFYSLDAMAKAQKLGQKTGNGATAPVDYQRRNYGKLIDYCLNDVSLTYQLFSLAYYVRFGQLVSPKKEPKEIKLRPLETAIQKRSRL